MTQLISPPGYQRLDGTVPVSYPTGMEDRALEQRGYLEAGVRELSALLGVGPPELQAILVAEDDRREAPRENSRPYPPGLPYFTRAATPPAVVLPEELSSAFRPRTEALLPLTVWHELAHAFLLREALVQTPVWLRELVPQTAAVAVARRTGLPLEEHLRRIDRYVGFTVRSFRRPASAEEQMAFQNLLLVLGAEALETFGEEPLRGLVYALWREKDTVGEERAEELLSEALGSGGEEWLRSRPEF